MGYGDITQVKSDALIALVKPRDWFDGINGAIHACAEGMFHAALRAASPLVDGMVIVAPTTGRHAGQFGKVIFVVDEQTRSLYEIVKIGLDAAAEQPNIRNVTLSVVRTGILGGLDVRDHYAAQEKMATVIRWYAAHYPRNLNRISVIWDRPLGLVVRPIKPA